MLGLQCKPDSFGRIAMFHQHDPWIQFRGHDSHHRSAFRDERAARVLRLYRQAQREVTNVASDAHKAADNSLRHLWFGSLNVCKRKADRYHLEPSTYFGRARDPDRSMRTRYSP